MSKISHPYVYIIIPVHNRKSFTKSCLTSLRKQTYVNFKIVVVNDGSTDGTLEMLKKEFPEVFVIQGDGNLWWTAATNLGVKYALDNNAEFILTLNNDTLAAEDFLEKMMHWAGKTPNSLLGAFALDAENGKPIYSGEIINWKYANSKFLLSILPEEQWHGLHEVTHYPGRGLLIPSQVFDNIGLFDEKAFPHYAADYDFTHRAIRDGFKVYCNYDAKLFIYPDESGDLQNRKQKTIKNYLRHINDIKGGGNISIFIKYSLKNCPNKYLPLFLPIGLLRRITGYWIRKI